MQLDAELAKILHRPPYADFSTVLGPVNFHIYLFSDNRGNQSHSGSGSLTLLNNVAARFLSEYGERPDNRLPLKTVKIGGRRVKFSTGRSKPRPDVVERILRFPYADPKLAETREQRANALQSEGDILLRTLQFGWFCRDSVFSVEWETDIVGSSIAVNDERREFRIAIARPTETFFVAIRFSRISYVQVHSELSTNASIIFFSLSEPPNFECSSGPGARQRLSYLPISDHKRVAPFTALAIRLVCSTRGDMTRFQRLAKTAGVKNMYDAGLHIERRGLFSRAVMDQLQAHTKLLRWSVAFQVEALLRNLHLDAKEILSIIPSIRNLVSSHGRTYATSFLRHFGTRARYWDAYEDSTQTIQQLFGEVSQEYSRLHAKAPSLDPADQSVFQSLHVVISPTTIYLEGPFVKRSNRVIRSFDSKNHDSFLRVRQVESNHRPHEGSLKYRFDKELDCVAFTRRRVGEFLIDNGLTIAGRKFKFLAYSQSALKEHAVWFVRSFRDANGRLVTAESIIGNLGSFDGLEFDPKLMYCPARYAARISQAFTATDSTTIEVEEVTEIDDISDALQKYHFTDGVGTMSLELAEAIWDELKASGRRKRPVKNHPRAYQIRFDGCKGMLSVNYRLKGHVMCLRPSMIKFNTEVRSRTIDIAKAFDKPGPYYLNRPLIMLLEGLGVPCEVFMGYQNKAVREVQASTRSLDAFARMLEIHGLGTAYRLPSVLLGLKQLGIDTLPGNKFYRKMLDFAVHHVLRLLKNKARIPIKDAVTLTSSTVGVADVHRYLKEGEIFVCTREADSNRLNFIEGDVLISRSPTIHPGDVQVVRAIGKPPSGSCFDHEPLPNTVVFSVRGQRPLPSYLGGGDLDGDTYNIIPLNKCPGFKLSKQQTHLPADYSPAAKKLVDHPSTMVDVAEFVIQYINSDALGMVAINWLLIADESGILHPDCMKLAALHSDAVDYPKTGQPVDISKIPRPKTKHKPDWNAPETLADYYPSTRAIGKLFRAIKLPDIEQTTLSRFERRMIREGRLRAPPVDDLADTLDGLDLDDDPMVLAIQTCVARYIRTGDRPSDIVDYIAQIFNRYASELQGICIAHTLSHGKMSLLSEEEAVVGTIIAKSSQPRKRLDLISSLREKSDFLVRSIKEELLGDDDVSWGECLTRGWLSFELAIELANGQHKTFGAHSFVWIALGAIFEALKELEEESKASRSSYRRR
ncbi:RNA-directed RNA polymerase 2 [Mycena vitilis]|nr:RNA-directed RNA polymerase 2 [Mycena vitilis]